MVITKTTISKAEKNVWLRPQLSVLLIKKDTFGGSQKWAEGHPNKPPKP